MQAATYLEQMGEWIDLTWVDREQNKEADALTNGDFSLFSPENRLEVVVDKKTFPVMFKLATYPGSPFLMNSYSTFHPLATSGGGGGGGGKGRPVSGSVPTAALGKASTWKYTSISWSDE